MGERDPDLAVGFRNVDGTEAPKKAVRFLEGLNTSQQVQQMLQLTHNLLGVREGFHILDGGCGLGDVARDLAARVGRHGRVVGIDRSEAMVTEARQRSQGTELPVEFYVQDIHHLDFPSESFDACRSSRVFIYLDDPRQALSELVRLTRPGGSVVLFEPEFDSWVLDGPDRTVVRKLVHFWTDQLRNPWIGRQLPGLFHSLGISDVSVTPVVGIWYVHTLEAFGLHSVLEKAVQQAVVTQAQVDEWLRFLRTADKNGTFYGAMTGLVVRGIKPARE